MRSLLLFVFGYRPVEFLIRRHFMKHIGRDCVRQNAGFPENGPHSAERSYTIETPSNRYSKPNG